MKCTSIIRESHLKKWLGYTGKSLESQDVNSDRLSNRAELANKKGMALSVHSKSSPTSRKGCRAALKNAKYQSMATNFGELSRLPRQSSPVVLPSVDSRAAWLLEGLLSLLLSTNGGWMVVNRRWQLRLRGERERKEKKKKI